MADSSVSLPVTNPARITAGKVTAGVGRGWFWGGSGFEEESAGMETGLQGY